MRSMTGYGRADGDGMTVEIRAVNHRYLDISVRLPRPLIFLEENIKSVLQKYLSRGKIEVIVTVEPSLLGSCGVMLNIPVLEGYLAALRNIKNEYGLPNAPSTLDILRLPDVVNLKREEPEQEEILALCNTLVSKAATELVEMREREGERLCADILEKSAAVYELVSLAEMRMPAVLEAYRKRLTDKLEALLETQSLDEQRVLTEVALMADKLSVDEETVRLQSHLSHLSELLRDGGAVGRKLDFLVQEMTREANTIGSKGNDGEMSRLVVAMKAEIEKIREQVQNFE